MLGDIRLSRLTWQDLEALYPAIRASGHGASYSALRDGFEPDP
jgi:hypothetical protein